MTSQLPQFCHVWALVNLGIGLSLSVASSTPAIAQIIPDNTLPVNSTVPVGCTNCLIQGGTLRGANLFHSFLEFNVGNNQRVFFANPGVERILTRVTGTNPSQIRGVLGVDVGNADLFLINPNGIVFGPNARLAIAGSFVATTATGLLFDNGFTFSAVNPQAQAPLLTVNLPIGLQYGNNPKAIQVDRSALQVPSGETLALVGGNVDILGARLRTLGGRLELGGLSEAGVIGLSERGSGIGFTFPSTGNRANITITDSLIETMTQTIGGEAVFNARTVEVSRSQMYGGVIPGSVNANRQAGDITINATESVQLTDAPTLITNSVFPGAVGNSGNLNINTRSLILLKSAQIGTTTMGRGNAGKVNIHASETVTIDQSILQGDSSIFNTIAPRAVGNAEGIAINTQSLFITNGGRITSATFGQGNAGSIQITANDRVALDGIGEREFPSAIVSQVASRGEGNGGTIEIATNTFSLTNGGQIATDTFGRGNAGAVQVVAANSINIDGKNAVGDSSGIFSSVQPNAIGQGGDVRLQTRSVNISNTGGLFASTLGIGNSGLIAIQTTETVSITAAGRVLATVEAGGIGNSQGIQIQTNTFSASGKAEVSSATFGQGNAGKIDLNATQSVTLSDPETVVRSRSGGISSNSRPVFVPDTAIGRGGDIIITTDQLTVTQGAILDAQTESAASGGTITVNANRFEANQGGQLRTTTLKTGQAGNMVLNLRDSLLLIGSDTGLFANTEVSSTGRGGNIVIDPKQVIIRDRATISVDSRGSGEGGNISIQAGSLTLDNRASISAETFSNSGGNIQLIVPDLFLLRRGSTISTTAGKAQSNGDGGNIAIIAGFIVAVPFENSDITANAFTGRGGNISINTQGIFGIAFRDRLTPFSDITASSEFGLAGTVIINTLGIDPVQAAAELPTTFATPPLAESCRAIAGQGSRFVNLGQGGLPTNPTTALMADTLWQDVEPFERGSREMVEGGRNAIRSQGAMDELTEAQGWVIGRDGKIMLTADAKNGMPLGSDRTRIHCTP